MRFFFLALIVSLTLSGFSQSTKQILLSGIVLNTDSLPVPDAAILNTRTGHTVRTRANGFFETAIAPNDSLLIYHIAYKRTFISEKDNGRIICIEPEIQELDQIDVSDQKEQEKRYLEKTVSGIKRLSSEKKPPEYTNIARQNQFIERNGTHTRGFMPFFGPTKQIPLSNLLSLFHQTPEKKIQKELTSHYHIVKKKNKKE